LTRHLQSEGDIFVLRELNVPLQGRCDVMVFSLFDTCSIPPPLRTVSGIFFPRISALLPGESHPMRFDEFENFGGTTI
jgi:hypothetical protein